MNTNRSAFRTMSLLRVATRERVGLTCSGCRAPVVVRGMCDACDRAREAADDRDDAEDARDMAVAEALPVALAIGRVSFAVRVVSCATCDGRGFVRVWLRVPEGAYDEVECPDCPDCAERLLVVCATCRGSGEGSHEGASCRDCGGSGEPRPFVDHDAEAEDSDPYDD